MRSFTSVRCRGYVDGHTAVAFERQLAIIFGCWDNVCASTRRWSLARDWTSCLGSKDCLRISTSKKEQKPKGVSGICGWATDRGWNGLGSGLKPCGRRLGAGNASTSLFSEGVAEAATVLWTNDEKARTIGERASVR